MISLETEFDVVKQQNKLSFNSIINCIHSFFTGSSLYLILPLVISHKFMLLLYYYYIIILLYYVILHENI